MKKKSFPKKASNVQFKIADSIRLNENAITISFCFNEIDFPILDMFREVISLQRILKFN